MTTRSGRDMISKIVKTMERTVLASCEVIRPFAMGLRSLGDVSVKADETLLTAVDKMSEDVGKVILRDAFPDIPFIGEEGGQSGANARYEFWYDPLDGTAPFVIGTPTSTVICALYDNIECVLKAVVIAEPAYQRVWSAIRGQGSYFRVADIPKQKRVVWPGDLGRGTGVFCDFTQGFKRDKGVRQIFSDHQALVLTTQLAANTRLLLLGSNGAHQAYVADGRDKVAGGITTAMGGPWDAAGALLVMEAGGAAKAFSMDKSILSERNPLNPKSYDILVYGNSPQTTETLTDYLKQAILEAVE